MGIVYKQSFSNTLSLFLGFFIGGINALFLYVYFLDEAYYGLVTFLLSTSVVLLPLLIFGMQSTVIKFYSNYKTKVEKDGFLITTLLFPLLIIFPVGALGILCYEQLSTWISIKNPMIKEYTYLIFLVALFMGYFELFYAWSKVQMQSVFGNLVKEVFQRLCTTFLLIAVYFKVLTNEQFIYAIVIVYAVRMLIMLGYALSVYRPRFTLQLPGNINEILRYSFYIILSASAGGILLEIDKFMIPQIEVGLEKVAYYSVGIYIASVVGIPTRAMMQIASPITAKALNDKNFKEVKKLYKESSLSLLIAGGLLFLLINLNVVDLYKFIGKPEYATGIYVVFMISIAKLFEALLATNSAILTNSRYYKVFFYFSVAMALSVMLLNDWLIHEHGANGAALATLIVVIIFGLVKLFFVHTKLNMHPITINTWIVLIVILLFYGFCYSWDFGLHPVINIIVKTVLISLFYVFTIYKLKLSKEFNGIVTKFMSKVFK